FRIRSTPSRPVAATLTWQPSAFRASAIEIRMRGSSSMIRTLGCGTAQPSFATIDRTAMAGSRTVNVVPRPTWLLTAISPPCRSTIPRLTESPNPVPSPCPLVVKNGSKIFGRTSGEMPQPVSSTSIVHHGPSWPERTVTTPSADRLHGVEYQIHEHLLEHVLVRHEVRQLVAEL